MTAHGIFVKVQDVSRKDTGVQTRAICVLGEDNTAAGTLCHRLVRAMLSSTEVVELDVVREGISIVHEEESFVIETRGEEMQDIIRQIMRTNTFTMEPLWRNSANGFAIIPG